MKKNIFISFLLFTIPVLYLTAQISHGGQPLSFSSEALKADIPVKILPAINIQALLAEDAIDELAIDIPMRFATDIPVSFTPSNSGQWTENGRGDRIWQLTLHSAGAYTLSIITKNFNLPQGAQLFIYNSDKQFLGSFTEANNKTSGIFATAPLAGESITLELFEPAQVKGQSIFEITHVVHGYRDIFSLSKGFGGSGPCNINVNCPQGNAWQSQKRSVAMILTSNNTRLCTGSLVNNVRQNGTPYFLTANHCLGGSSSDTWIFMFNYESSGCASVDGPTTQTIQGSTLRANDSPSDFALLELSTAPPPNYNVFFSGWNANDSAPDSVVCIHHPSGDIKKITFDYDTALSYGYSNPGNDHWRITEWEVGTTEGGSSGSSLFDKHKRIVGQLHGGAASCTNPTGYDAYGKFSYSWQTGATPSKRLKDWLDPDDTGILQLDGADFNTPQYNTDAALSEINTPTTGYTCQLNLTPEISLRNNGADVLTSVTINYVLNGGPVQSVPWSGSLNFFETATVILPTITLNEGAQTFIAYLSNPNGNPDQNTLNDTLNVSFNALLGNGVQLYLTTDNYPEEISWEVLDSTGTILFTNGSLGVQSTHIDNFCLPNGCYDFVINDSYGDGLAGSLWPPSPPGTYTVMLYGDTLGAGSGNFGFTDTIHFCIYNASISNITKEISISVYPNPATDKIYISPATDDNTMLFIYNTRGQCIHTQLLKHKQNTILQTPWPGGLYFFKIVGESEIYDLKVVIE